MGSDWKEHIPTVIAWIREINPSSVLDVGVGFGKWGCLEKGRRPRLVGIECFEPDSRRMYDDILAGDALERIHDAGLFDLVVIGDVLERFTRTQADCMLVNASAIAKAVLIVASGSAVKFRHVRGMFRVLRHQMFENGGRGWMALIEGQRARAGEGTP